MQTIFSWEIMSIEANRVWKLSVYYWLTKSNTQRTSFYCVEIMNVLQLIEFMDFMTSVRDDTILNYGKHSPIVLIAYLLPL